MRPLRDVRGFTLLELLTVVVLVGVAASLAAPALDGWINRVRTRGALRQLTADLYYARVLAVRSGRSVVVRFPAAGRCPGSGANPFGSDRYVVVVRDVPERVAKTVVLGDEGGLCLQMNQSDSVRFDTRGLLRGLGNRSLVAHRGGVRDSIAISRAGRILRPH